MAQHYGEDSVEFERAQAKLRRVKEEELAAKTLPQQVRSLEDQIRSQQSEWLAVDKECLWLESEVDRMSDRHDMVVASNAILGDEIE